MLLLFYYYSFSIANTITCDNRSGDIEFAIFQILPVVSGGVVKQGFLSWTHFGGPGSR